MKKDQPQHLPPKPETTERYVKSHNETMMMATLMTTMTTPFRTTACRQQRQKTGPTTTIAQQGQDYLLVIEDNKQE